MRRSKNVKRTLEFASSVPDRPVLRQVIATWEGSDGEATRALYARLLQLGPAGDIAVNLFRANKTSTRAKAYRGRQYKGAAYDTKEWSIGNLSKALSEHAGGLGITWGWKVDPEQATHRQVLYVDLPTGQVSFHCAQRFDGPDYAGDWDGIGRSAERIVLYCAQLLDAEVAQHVEVLLRHPLDSYQPEPGLPL